MRISRPTSRHADTGPVRSGTRGILSRPGDRWYAGYLYLAPGLVVYGALILYPAASTLWFSFRSWSGIGTATWVGLANYLRLAGDSLFWKALSNNLLFLVFYTVVPLGIGLTLAVALHRYWSRTAAVFRVLLFLPQILPMALVGVIWRWMYNPAFGPINRLLRDAGLAALARPWLGDFDWALPSVGVVASWYFYGFCLAVFLAGMQKIDRSLYDAARIDGAGSGQQFRYITLPELRGEIAVAATFTLIAALRVFDLVFVTTRGGPGTRTLVAALYLYRHAFQQSAVGYGAAVAMVISILVIGATLLLRRWQERDA